MIVKPIVCSTFVGRREELDYLIERRRAAATSRGGGVLVFGEAGIGKSRLLAEFVRATGRSSRVRVAASQTLQYAQRPYGPVLDLLARFDPAAAAIVPARSQRDQLDAIVDAFARLARKHALVAIIEDLHWADADTLELLHLLVGMAANARMLFVMSARVDDGSGSERLAGFTALERVAGVGRIVLAPLAGADLESFVDAALDGVALEAQARAAVVHMGDGNPFFTEELLQHAVDASPGARRQVLPATVRAAVAARLRQVNAEGRRMLTYAAIIGRRFDGDLLAATLEVSPETLVEQLHDACRLRLLVEEEANTFAFRHALTREAIYREHLRLQVQPIHRHIAATLEERGGNVEDLAYHWAAAGDDRKALAFSLQAAEAATRVHAYAHAIRHYRVALDAAPDPKRTAAIWRAIGDMSVRLGAIGEALVAHDRAAEAYRALGDIDGEMSARFQAAGDRYVNGDATAPLVFEGIVARLEALGDRSQLARARLLAARFHGYFGDAPAARRALDAAEPDLDRANANTAFSYETTRSLIAAANGDLAAYRGGLAALFGAADRTTDSLSRIASLSNAGSTLTLLGDLDAGEQYAKRALAASSAENVRGFSASMLCTLALAALMRGRLGDARRYLEQAHELRADYRLADVGVAAWGTLLAALTGDDEFAVRSHRPAFAAPDASPEAWLSLAWGYAERSFAVGDAVRAGDAVRRAFRATARAASWPVCLAAARSGPVGLLPQARAMLAAYADPALGNLHPALLALFDAYGARRRGDLAAAAGHGATARREFERRGYALLAAEACAASGDRAAAVAAYRTMGALGMLRRLEADDGLASQPAALSAREREVARLVASGSSNAQIAHALSLSLKTVEKHLSSSYRKLGLRTRSQLAVHFARSADAAHADG